MSVLTESPAWKALAAHRDEMQKVHLRELFAQDPRRFERFSLELDDILLAAALDAAAQQQLADFLSPGVLVGF